MYKGILYFGGILAKEGNRQKVYAVEFNARWGDPEAQVIIPGIHSDFYELNASARTGNLDLFSLNKDALTRIAVAGTAKGYPLDYSAVQGKKVLGLQEAGKKHGVTIYGAGITERDKHYVVNGGRVFYVVGEGETVVEARGKAYSAMDEISIEGDNLHYRNDIGWRDMLRVHEER